MPHNMPVPMLLEISMAAASPEATSAASASAADMEESMGHAPHMGRYTKCAIDGCGQYIIYTYIHVDRLD